MTDESAAIAPGWYRDPEDHAQERWWDGRGWTTHARARDAARTAAGYTTADAMSERVNPSGRGGVPAVPGRISGFVCSLIGLLTSGFPIASIPLAIIGIVLSMKALRTIPPAVQGRGLPTVGAVLGWLALAATVYAIGHAIWVSAENG